jgi:hypothetical protein
MNLPDYLCEKCVSNRFSRYTKLNLTKKNKKEKRKYRYYIYVLQKKIPHVRHCLSFLPAGSSSGSDGRRFDPGAGDANRGERRCNWVS